MGITPITAIHLGSTFKPRDRELGQTEIFEIENSSRTGDETYSPGGNKSASGFEDEEEGLMEQEDADGLDDAKPEATKSAEETGGEISFFA